MTISSSQESLGGKRAIFSGREGLEFSMAGQRAFVILPPEASPIREQPWVWYAPTLPGLPGDEEKWMFQKFLDSGVAIAGIDVGESYGSPAGSVHFTTFHRYLISDRGFAPKPGLLARSRGGLMLYNWAIEHAESVACIAGIYPVCNLASYPGLAKACGAFGLTESELAAHLIEHNPFERLAPLARAHVPILHLHGDQDEIVPLAENSTLLAERYRQEGGEIQLLVFPGRGHDRWSGWFESQDLVDFLLAHVRTRT